MRLVSREKNWLENYLQIFSIFLIIGMLTSTSPSGLDEYSLLVLARAGLAWDILARGRDCFRRETSLEEDGAMLMCYCLV